MSLDIENTKKLTFRVLNQEECNKYDSYKYDGSNDYVISREKYIRHLGIKKLGDITRTVNSHVVSGNAYITNWISTSKDLINTLQKYAYEDIEYNHDILRPYLAIIKNHASSALELKPKNGMPAERIDFAKLQSSVEGAKVENLPIASLNKMKEAPLDIFSKIVFDCSTREKYVALQELEFIMNKNGSHCKMNNQTSINYAEANKEVLVNGKIDNSAIIFGSPLYADLLYVYSRYNTSFDVIRGLQCVIRKFEDAKDKSKCIPLLADFDIDYYIELKESMLRKICNNIELQMPFLKNINKPTYYSYEKINKEYVVDEVKRLILKK